MNAERFRTLIDTYGGDPQRWPPGEREEASAFAGSHAQAGEWLAQSARLDAWLDGYAVPPPDSALAERILAGVPRPPESPHTPSSSPSPHRLRPAGRSAPWAGLGWLLPGAGVAGVGLAGAVAGAFAVSAALHARPPAVDGLERASAFTQLYSDWSRE